MASGTGLHRLTRPVVMLSLVLGALSLFIVGWLQPHTRYAYRSVVFDVKNVDVFYLAEEGVFMQAGTRTFILDKLEPHQQHLRPYLPVRLSRACRIRNSDRDASGVLIPVPGQRRPVLRLENGHRLKLDRWPTLDSNAEIPQAGVAEFATTETPLGQGLRQGLPAARRR